MKKVLAILMLAPMLIACTGNQKSDAARSKLDQYVDSMMEAYPNYAGNISVAKLICDDFEKRLDTLPGILEGVPFEIVGIHEIAGEVSVMISAEAGSSAGNPEEMKRGKFASVSVWCENFDKDKAPLLDKNKTYKVTGGKVASYKGVNGMAEGWLKLGDIYVTDLQLEEVGDAK